MRIGAAGRGKHRAAAAMLEGTSAGMHALDIYRRTLTSARDEDSAWWYLGTGIVTVPGHPPIIVNHVETVMIYRAATIDAESYRVPWWEIGVFRDPITGEVPEEWFNPLTGVTVPAARTFEEGPSGFSIRSAGDEGLEIFDAVQAFAELESARVDFRELGERIVVTQTERKRRAFPDAGGIPELDERTGSQAHTVLQWSVAKADLASDAVSVPATGSYSLDIDTPAWLGLGEIQSSFQIVGTMHKSAMNAPLNPRGWADLQRLFPHYFENGKIRPRWA